MFTFINGIPIVVNRKREKGKHLTHREILIEALIIVAAFGIAAVSVWYFTW
jgi:hypothetical protein